MFPYVSLIAAFVRVTAPVRVAPDKVGLLEKTEFPDPVKPVLPIVSASQDAAVLSAVEMHVYLTDSPFVMLLPIVAAVEVLTVTVEVELLLITKA